MRPQRTELVAYGPYRVGELVVATGVDSSGYIEVPGYVQAIKKVGTDVFLVMDTYPNGSYVVRTIQVEGQRVNDVVTPADRERRRLILIEEMSKELAAA